MFTTFSRDKSWNFAHEFFEPLSTRSRRVFLPFFFVGNLGFLMTKMSPQKRNDTFFGEKKQQKHRSVTDWHGLIDHTRKISGSISQNGVNFRLLTTKWVGHLEPACMYIVITNTLPYDEASKNPHPNGSPIVPAWTNMTPCGEGGHNCWISKTYVRVCML